MRNWFGLFAFGRPAPSFEVGDQVRVIAGPFAAFNGTVEAVNRSRLQVAVSILDRVVTAELRANAVEKI
jgi:transcription termination/antitermination protein NusG